MILQQNENGGIYLKCYEIPFESFNLNRWPSSVTTLNSLILLTYYYQLLNVSIYLEQRNKKSASDLFKTDMLPRHTFSKFEQSSKTSETKLILL